MPVGASSLADRFELGPEIGEGGMGVIHQARDRATGRDVAVKLLRERKPAIVERFVREAEALELLAHAGIVRHVAHGTNERGEPWLAMEWIEGPSLARRIEGMGPLAIADAMKVGQRMAEALAHAHALGILHRDLKPENVILRGGSVDEPVLIDFGIARFADVRATRTGVTMGTPGYMSPEQAVGDKDLDARADVFALGSVLFECVTGRPAFEGSHPMAILAKLMVEDPPPIAAAREGVPEALDALVARMMAKDRAQRPSTMDEVARALEAILADPSHARASSPPQLTLAEQRLVTVVAASAPGTLGDTIDGDGLTLHEGESAAAPKGAIEAEAQRVAKLASGALVGVFTGDATPADQAARATRAAIAHARATPGARIVVATGRVVVTGHVPVGPVIETAVAALTSSRGPGVRLDSATAGLVGDRWVMRVVSGSLFEVAGERVREAPLRGVLGQATPFVGRERELAMIESAFDACASGPSAGALLVTAPVGHGKSRLRREVVARIESRGHVLLARGENLGAGAAYAMLGPMVRRAAGVLEGEPVEAQRARLSARIASVIADPEEARTVAEFVGELAQIPYPEEGRVALAAARADPRLLGDRMRGAFLAWMRAECARGPVLLVLEDLQWGDRPTVQLVEATLRELADAPLFVLALARPEVKETFPSLWSGTTATEVALGPISRKAAQQLVRAVLGDELDDPTVARVVERAAGSPLFLEELTRAVASGKDELPENVVAIAQRRLDELAPELRRVLRAASVLGHRIHEGALAALLGEARAGARTRDAIEVLVRREILLRRTETSLAGDVEYAFVHDVLRDAAYASLPDAERAIAHRIAGAWLEERGIESAVVRAEHHGRGGEGALAAKAWLEAARESLAGDDLAAALERAERGLAIGATGAVAIELQMVAALAHRWAFRPREADIAAATAFEHATPGSEIWFRAVGERMLSAARTGDHAALDRWITIVRGTSAENGGAAIARADCALTAGGQLALYGATDRAAEMVRLAESALGRPLSSEPRIAGRNHMVLALIAAGRGEVGASIAAYRESIVRFEAIGDARSAAGSRVNAALQQIEIGLVEDGLAMLERALADAERLGLAYILAFTRSNLALALERVGRLDEAEAQLRIVLEQEPGARSRLIGSAHIYLARVHLGRGDLEDALASARTGVEVTESFPPMHALALAVLSMALGAAGRSEEALATATQAMAIVERLGTIDEGESCVRLAHVEALLALDRTDEAIAGARAACARLHALAARLGDERMRRALFERVRENGRLLELAGE